MREYFYRLATDKEKGFLAQAIKFFLAVLSFFYSLVIRILIIIRQHRPVRLSCKVISVGNITLGGTGKTTVVEYIARFLKAKGHKVAVLTRGYKRSEKRLPDRQAGKAKSAKLQYETMGDEAYMLTQKLGDVAVIVDADRIKGAKRAIQDYSVDTLILDDGLQQWHISKDLEIVAIDAPNPFGNKKMIPRGILREPLVNLSRADIFILTKTNFHPDTGSLKDFLKSLNSTAGIFESSHAPVGFFDFNHSQESIDLGALKGKNVVLFCGIGDPDSFAAVVSSLGINISTFFKFPDHHNYSRKDLERIAQAAQEKGIDTVITTEKDAARFYDLRPTAPDAIPTLPYRIGGYAAIAAGGVGYPPHHIGEVGTPPSAAPPSAGTYDLKVLVLHIALKINNEQEFYHRLLGLYSL